MSELSHINFPEVGDTWYIDDIPVLLVINVFDNGVEVCTQRSYTSDIWDTEYTKHLTLSEFRKKLSIVDDGKEVIISTVVPYEIPKDTTVTTP